MHAQTNHGRTLRRHKQVDAFVLLSFKIVLFRQYCQMEMIFVQPVVRYKVEILSVHLVYYIFNVDILHLT